MVKHLIVSIDGLLLTDQNTVISSMSIDEVILVGTSSDFNSLSAYQRIHIAVRKTFNIGSATLSIAFANESSASLTDDFYNWLSENNITFFNDPGLHTLSTAIVLTSNGSETLTSISSDKLVAFDRDTLSNNKLYTTDSSLDLGENFGTNPIIGIVSVAEIQLPEEPVAEEPVAEEVNEADADAAIAADANRTIEAVQADVDQNEADADAAIAALEARIQQLENKNSVVITPSKNIITEIKNNIPNESNLNTLYGFRREIIEYRVVLNKIINRIELGQMTINSSNSASTPTEYKYSEIETFNNSSTTEIFQNQYTYVKQFMANVSEIYTMIKDKIDQL